MRTIPIAPSSALLRWIFVANILAITLVAIFSLHLEDNYPLESFILPLMLAGVLVIGGVSYVLTFPLGIAIIHRGIRSATEGSLKPIKIPRRTRLIFGPIIEDYNTLIRNMGSLFHEMERSQLSVIGDRNRNDAILRSLPGALLIVDSDYLVTLSNKHAEQLFDLCTEDLLGTNLFELLPLNEDGREILREAFLYELQVNNKEIVLVEGNLSRHYTLNITFFRQTKDAVEYCAAVVLQDITDYKRLQELIYQSEKFLAIGKLAGGISHELNTPLGTIVGYAQLLNEGVSSEDKRQQYVHAIYSEAKRCSTIIENLRKFAQRDVCQPESCEISTVIREVVETIHNCPSKKNNVKIETHLAANAPVLGAGGQLDIVLVNLIMNAVQAADGVAADPLVSVVSSVKDDSVTISIADNGPGIPRSQRNHIFDPFFSTKADGSGLGLGLAISQSIVTRIGGTLSCDPDYEAGTRFILSLPLAIREVA